MANSVSWEKIVKDNKILEHDFKKMPFVLSAIQIKKSVQDFSSTAEKEVRILCKQDSREDRPQVFKDNNLFLLPVKNGIYNIVQGEGYVDIPEIKAEVEVYKSKLDFELDTSVVGNSEMQHLDYAYAASLIRTFVKDPTLVLTIRGRKYTPQFDFYVNKQLIEVRSVQTEVDAGYEGEEKIVLIEAKSSGSKNTIIRQLYYPFRQWQKYSKKKVTTLFFEKDLVENIFSIWEFGFKDIKDYNSINLVRAGRFKIL